MRLALLLGLVILASSCGTDARVAEPADAPAALEGRPPLGGYGPVI